MPGGCGQPVVLAYQPAAGSAFNFRLDRTDAGPRAETEGDVDPVGVRQLFLEPGRKAIGWHDVEARARAEHHARSPGAPVLGMTAREDRDFAGDVQVMHVPADASLDERRGGCGERTGAVRHVPCRESACSDGLESMIRRVRTELKFTFA